jgi:hypothetical protein
LSLDHGPTDLHDPIAYTTAGTRTQNANENNEVAAALTATASKDASTSLSMPTTSCAQPSSLPPAFTEGQHIGPTAGVSFLYHVFNQNERHETEMVLPAAPLSRYGDVTQKSNCGQHALPSREDAQTLLNHYFRFGTPTYRFFHKPTLEKWMSQLLDSSSILISEAACALLVCAQSLICSRDGDSYCDEGDDDFNRSRYCKTMHIPTISITHAHHEPYQNRFREG